MGTTFASSTFAPSDPGIYLLMLLNKFYYQSGLSHLSQLPSSVPCQTPLCLLVSQDLEVPQDLNSHRGLGTRQRCSCTPSQSLCFASPHLLRACSGAAMIRVSFLIGLVQPLVRFPDVSHHLYLLMVHPIEGLGLPQRSLFFLITLCHWLSMWKLNQMEYLNTMFHKVLLWWKPSCTSLSVYTFLI